MSCIVIELFDEKQRNYLIQIRRKTYCLGKNFFLLTPDSFLFLFDLDSDCSLRDFITFSVTTTEVYLTDYNKDVLKTYRLDFGNRLYFANKEKLNSFLDTAYSDLSYLFASYQDSFKELVVLKQELKHRGLR